MLNIRLLFRERQTQDSSVGVCQPSQAEATPTGIRMELSSVSSGSAKEQSTLQGDSSEVREKTVSAEEEPMETHTAAAVDAGDDDQPRSKLSKAVPYSSQVKSSQSNISTPSQSGQTSSAGSTVRGAGDEEDMPYFPAHPFNYFPDDIKSSASRPPPPQRIGPVSMFDQQISLYAISEDESSVHVTTLEPFQVGCLMS